MIAYLKISPPIGSISNGDTLAIHRLVNYPVYDTVISRFFTDEWREKKRLDASENAEIGLGYSIIGLNVMDEYLDYLPWDSLHVGNDPNNQYLLDETNYQGVILDIYYQHGNNKIPVFYICFNKHSGKIFSMYAHAEQNQNLLHWLTFCAKYRPAINAEIEKIRLTGIFNILPEKRQPYKKRKQQQMGVDKIISTKPGG